MTASNNPHRNFVAILDGPQGDREVPRMKILNSLRELGYAKALSHHYTPRGDLIAGPDDPKELIDIHEKQYVKAAAHKLIDGSCVLFFEAEPNAEGLTPDIGMKVWKEADFAYVHVDGQWHCQKDAELQPAEQIKEGDNG